MGEIAESLISGEFDFITGEHIGEAVGYPRTHAYRKAYSRKAKYTPSFEEKITSKANLCITNMCKSRGFSNREKVKLVAKFLYSNGYNQLPKLQQQYKIIYDQYKSEFRKFLVEKIKEMKYEERDLCVGMESCK